MKTNRLSLAAIMILVLSQVSNGQSRFTGFAGYNVPNEVYAGIQSTAKSKVNYAIELTYRHASKQNAQYYFGPFPSPFLLKYASGFGIRTSLVFSVRPTSPRYGQLIISLQYQDLQTPTIVKDDGAFTGSNLTLYSEFMDSYNDIGVIGSHVLPFIKSKRLGFTYSFGITARHVSRQYSIDGNWRNKLPSNRVEDFWTVVPEIRAGFRFYFSKTLSTQ